jgi:putative Holliday junction resolvase
MVDEGVDGGPARRLRPGVRLGLDWGDARIGVAACDRAGVLAYPVTTIAAGGGSEAGTTAAIDAVVALVAEYEPLEILFGLPRSLSGREGPAAVRLRAVAVRLAGVLAAGPVPVPVRLVDERLSTVTAAQALRASGKNARQQRSRIDRAAAVAIVEHALDGERATGRPSGELVSPESA